MTNRNLADPDWEPSDEDFAELLEHAAEDVRATKARVTQALGESGRAALEAKLLEALSSAERELSPADWGAIRTEGLARLEARKTES